MLFEIPDSIMQSSHLSEPQLRIELASFLYQRNFLTLGKAAEFCNLTQFEMQRELKSRNIPSHYDLNDWDEDLKMVSEF